MNNTLVMRAIEREMEWIHDKVICNPKNEGKDMTKWKNEINDLYDAYFELRGNTGSASYIAGMDSEVNTVKSIQQLVNGR